MPELKKRVGDYVVRLVKPYFDQDRYLIYLNHLKTGEETYLPKNFELTDYYAGKSYYDNLTSPTRIEQYKMQVV